MKVLITGISGFVGPHLARELSRNGHLVSGLDREGGSENIFPCDLTDKSAVTDFFESKRFDWVIHLAALTSVQESWKKPEVFLRVNSLMTENIYRALEYTNSETSVLLISTSDVYGAQKTFPIRETAEPNPGNPYAKSKLAQEQTALSNKKIKTVISRAFNHAGPGSSAFLAIPSFARQIALWELGKQDYISVGNLESYRDYLDVRDVVRAYRLLIERGENQETYNICSGVKQKMEDVLSAMLNLSSKKIEIKQNPDLMRPSDIPEFWGDHSKITQLTGWQPEISFEQTLLDTLEYWRKQVK